MKVGIRWIPHGSGNLGVGISFVGLAIASGFFILPDAKKSASPILYVLILGGLFVGIPAALGIGVIIEQMRLRKNQRDTGQG